MPGDIFITFAIFASNVVFTVYVDIFTLWDIIWHICMCVYINIQIEMVYMYIYTQIEMVYIYTISICFIQAKSNIKSPYYSNFAL